MYNQISYSWISESVEPKLGQNTLLEGIYETWLKQLWSCPEIVMSHESERFGVSYPEDQSVHQTIDARTLKLGATAVLHELGIWTWDRNRESQTCYTCISHTHIYVSHTPKHSTNLRRWPGRSKLRCCGGRILVAAYSGWSGCISCLSSTESHRNDPACCWGVHTPPHLHTRKSAGQANNTHTHKWKLDAISQMSTKIQLQY